MLMMTPDSCIKGMDNKKKLHKYDDLFLAWIKHKK